MSHINTLKIFLSLSLLFSFTHAATFNVVNQCSYTVWAAASPGGGQRLDSGQSWTFDVAAGTTGGRVWGRTNCNFDSSGHGSCQSGDCNGLLQCTGYGSPPNTLAEYALNQFQNMDFIDISLVDGFNIPMEFSATSGCSTDIKCAGTSILDECPSQLKVTGGCDNPCTVFKTDEYCCTNAQSTCGATEYSKFFKDRCPDAYSYPKDDQTSTFTCPSGANYKVTFCP